MNLKITYLISWLIAALLIVCCNGTSLAENISITHYDIQATLPSVPANNLFVNAKCEIQREDNVSKYKMLFSAGTKISSIKCLLKGKWFDVPYSFTGTDTLELDFPKKMNKEKSFTLEFIYAYPIDLQDSSILMLDRGHRWYPLLADCVASIQLSTSVPEGFEVLSTGDLIRQTLEGGNSTFTWESSIPVFKIPLMIFRTSLYRKESSQAEGREVILYTSANYDTLSTDKILPEADSIFSFCTKNIGEYPYKQLTFFEVQDFSGINIGSGLLSVGSPNIDLWSKGFFEGLDLSVAEQWIGAGVFAKYGEPGFWFLSLSLPHYIRLMYVKHNSEEEYEKSMMGTLEKYKEFSGTVNDIPLLDVDFPNTREKGLILYGKGPYIFSLLNKQMGDEKWHSFLQELYKEYRGKILTYENFRNDLAKYDDGGTLIPMLDRLVKEKGLPE
jgi:hypothetical protein